MKKFPSSVIIAFGKAILCRPTLAAHTHTNSNRIRQKGLGETHEKMMLCAAAAAVAFSLTLSFVPRCCCGPSYKNVGAVAPFVGYKAREQIFLLHLVIAAERRGHFSHNNMHFFEMNFFKEI